MINFNFNKNCYGCSACKNICPKNAIKMVENSEGFLIPQVDKEKCINCGLCEKVCIHINNCKEENNKQKNVIYGAYRKDKNNYKNYTSAGVFTFFAEKFVNDNNYVCGCAWDENMKATHIISDKKDIVKLMSNSKYVQSDMNDILVKICEKLKQGKKVLFSGTPCQVSAVKSFVNKKKINGELTKNLYTISIACHGVPSPGVWRNYKEKLERKYGSKMNDANFRYKGKFGWLSSYTKYTFENGKMVSKLSYTDDEYVINFGLGIMHRNTCYNCCYKLDLIIADFWGCSNKMLKKSKNKGISAIICRTEKGQEMINLMNDDFEIFETTIDRVIKENKPIIHSVKANKNRREFFKCYQDNGDCLSLFNKSSKLKIKSLLYRLGIFEIAKRIRYYLKHMQD